MCPCWLAKWDTLRLDLSRAKRQNAVHARSGTRVPRTGWFDKSNNDVPTLPSGKLAVCDGKSACLIGKCKWSCSIIDMLNCQRVSNTRSSSGLNFQTYGCTSKFRLCTTMRFPLQIHQFGMILRSTRLRTPYFFQRIWLRYHVLSCSIPVLDIAPILSHTV